MSLILKIILNRNTNNNVTRLRQCYGCFRDMIPYRNTHANINVKGQSSVINASNNNDNNNKQAEAEEPLNYFGSKAASWKAKQSRSGGHKLEDEDMNVPYQSYVISGSLFIFLLYFCVLREENDIDVKLNQSLYNQVEGLEVTQLKVIYNYNKDNNLPIDEIEQRLLELGVEVVK